MAGASFYGFKELGFIPAARSLELQRIDLFGISEELCQEGLVAEHIRHSDAGGKLFFNYIGGIMGAILEILGRV